MTTPDLPRDDDRVASQHRLDHVRQFVRFVLVGVLNTGFSYGIYSLGVFLGLNYAVANLVSLLIGIVFSFKTQSALVFRNTDNRRIFRYVVAWTVIYLVNVFLIGRFKALGLNDYAAGAVALPFTVVLSYVTMKFFVFGAPTRS